MKKALLILAAMALFSQAQAQLFSFGLRGGISSSSIKIEDPGTWEVDKREPDFGFHVGVFSRLSVPLTGLYVQPELLFSNTGGTVVLKDGNNTSNLYYSFNRIDLPVLVGWKFSTLRLNAGPILSYIASGKQQENGVTVDDFEDKYKNSTLGYQAGVGFDLGKLLIDLKYEGSLSKFGESVSVGNTSFPTDQRNTQLILSLGLKF